jgi:hypothetical protein
MYNLRIHRIPNLLVDRIQPHEVSLLGHGQIRFLTNPSLIPHIPVTHLNWATALQVPFFSDYQITQISLAFQALCVQTHKRYLLSPQMLQTIQNANNQINEWAHS